MTVSQDVDALLVLLDAQFAFFARQQGEERLLFVPRLLRFLSETSQLAALVEELRDEGEQQRAELEARYEALRNRIGNLWEKHRKVVRELLGPALAEAKNERLLFVHLSFDEFERALRIPLRLKLARPLTTDDKRHPDKLLDALAHWAKSATESARATNSSAELELHALIATIDGLRAEAGLLDRVHGQLSRTVPGTGIEQFDDITARLASQTEEDARMIKRVLGKEWRGQFVAWDEADSLASDAASAAELLHDELRLRILGGRSRWALVRRYAARAEGFDAFELRQLVDRDTKNAERTLTTHFARYLFDQGLAPLIDPTIGGLRPDVLHLYADSLLYVEAKQYATRHPTHTLKKAFGQVWGTWGRLRNQHNVPEAFILVFRRSSSAPRIEFPEMPIRYEGRSLYVLLVDLAENAGSREKLPPIQIGKDTLLPMLASSPTRTRKREARA